MRSLGVVPALFLTSCIQLGTSGDPDAGAGAAGGAAFASDAPAVMLSGGSGCAIDSASGASLCTTFDGCPGVAVDHDVYPDCGFRVPSTTIDLECVCGDFLCPVGAVLNCGQATVLLAEQSEVAACVQQNEGRGAPRSSSKPDSSTCDRNCADSCSGDINCRKLCGC
jgi:hypothetical protein